jgi:hypothetical protein
MILADSAFAALGAIRAAPDRAEVVDVEKQFESAVKEFVVAAGVSLRAAG